MLQVFYGNNQSKVRDAVLEYVNTYTGKGFIVNNIDQENYSVGSIANALQANALFSEDSIYILDYPLSDEEMKAEFYSLQDELVDSLRPFVVVENNLLAADLKSLSKKATITKLTDSKEDSTKSAFNIFSLTDVLCRRDKKQLWIRLQDAHKAGIAPEEIVGVLWWQIKSIYLASIYDSAQEADLKPFPYKKAKEALRVYSKAEVEDKLESLLTLYHEAHSGKVDFKNGLEEWVLRI